MMKILAIETSTEAFSVALQIDNDVNEVFQIAPQQHAMLLLPTIENLLETAKIKLNQIDLLAFGCGPGSFTGVRMAASAAQGLAFGCNLRVAAISTLQALAQEAHAEMGATSVLAALDARMQEIYFGVYEVDSAGIMRPCCDDMLLKPDAEVITKMLQAKNIADHKYYCAGNAWEIYKIALPVDYVSQKFAQKNVIYPRARYIAQLCHLAYASTNMETILKIGIWESALPVYLRDKVTS